MKVSFNNVQDFEQYIENNSFHEFIVLEFFTTWCFSCQKLKKVMQDLEKKKDNLTILEIDAEKSFKISQDPKFKVLSVPTLFIFKGRELLKKVEGYIDLESLEKILV